jgi:hypothetical protein
VGIAAFLPWLAKLAPELTGYSKGLKLLAAPDALGREVISKHVDNYKEGEERDFIDVALTKIYNTQDPTSMFYGEVGCT